MRAGLVRGAPSGGAAARGCLQQEALGLTVGRGCRKREKRDGQEEAAALSP